MPIMGPDSITSSSIRSRGLSPAFELFAMFRLLSSAGMDSKKTVPCREKLSGLGRITECLVNLGFFEGDEIFSRSMTNLPWFRGTILGLRMSPFAEKRGWD